MAQQLETALAAINTVIAGVTGIRQSHNYAPENPSVWPAAVIFPQSGKITASPIGSRKALHNINIDLLVPEQQSNLARQLELLYPFLDTIPAALLAEVSDTGDQFSGTISTFGEIAYTFIVVNYAAVPCRGYRFTMRDVKILVNT
jgi:hypothetical protein